MAKHDIVVLNSTSSGFETDLGNNVARIKGDADDLLSVRNSSEVSKFAVSSVESSIIVDGSLTLTGNLSSSLASTASLGRIDVTNLTGDASQMTNVNQIGHVSSSKQLAARISGAFNHGFELDGENRVISGSVTSTGSFTRVFANIYSGDASDMFGVDESGHFSGSAQLASNISGSFNKGFEFSGALTATQILTASYVGVSGSAFAYAGNTTTMSISSICGSDFDYRLEDGIKAGKIKGTSYGMGSWSTGPNRIVTAGFGAAAGTQNAYLSMGGYTPTGTDATEKYNGSSWAVSATLTAADCANSAAGTQNAVVLFNGHADPDGSEIYNGATFSETANRTNGKRNTGAAGTQNASIVFGGMGPSPSSNAASDETENFDGDTFSALNAMNTPFSVMASGGTQNSAIAAFGYNAPTLPGEYSTALWNGTSWSAAANGILARRGLNGHGTQNHFLAVGGQTNTCIANTEEWNGTSWSEQSDLPTAKGASAISGGGLGSAAIFAGGFTQPAGARNTVEFWNAGLSNTGSFGRVDIGGVITGDASQVTGVDAALPSGVISSSAQLAAEISGTFTSGFQMEGTLSGSTSNSTASFGNYIFGSSISISDVSELTGIPSTTDFVSGSAQIAADISGSFNKGFEFDGKISGSVTSTGSFSRLNFNDINATDISGITNHEIGHIISASEIAADISASIQSGFTLEGTISGSSDSTLIVHKLDLSSTSFTIPNTGSIVKNWDSSYVRAAAFGDSLAADISGSFNKGLRIEGIGNMISGSVTSTGSFNRTQFKELYVKNIIDSTRKQVSGSMDHTIYISGSYKSNSSRPITIPTFGRGHTMNTQQFSATGSMQSQKYRAQAGQLFVDNFGRLNMTVQTGSEVAVAGTWEAGPTTILKNNGYAATAGVRDAFIMGGGHAASGSAIYDGIGWQRTSDVTTTGSGTRAKNCGIGTVDAAFIMRYMSGTQGGSSTGKYGPFPTAPAVHGVLQEIWDGIGWYRGSTTTNSHVKRGGTAGKIGSVNSHIAFNGDDYPTLVGTAAWNGVTWQDVGPHTPVARDNGAGFGGEYDGVVAGGFVNPAAVSCVDEWNGTSWATATALPTALSGAGGAGPQTAGLVIGGPTFPYKKTLEYNGTSWSEETELPIAMSAHGTGGTVGKAFSATTAATYLWTGAFVTGSSATHNDFQPSANGDGRYLLTKKLQANLSPGTAGGATSGSSEGFGGGY